ncbi:MAG: flagellar assembly protein FliX, partial [Pseudomonadota bacterium]
MKVGEYSPVSKAGRATGKKNVSAAGGDFLGLLALGEPDATPQIASTTDVQSLSMDTLLSLQQMPEEEFNRKKALQESFDLLDTLDNLRNSLLGGEISKNTLAKLQNIVALKKQVGNDS